MKVTKYIFVTGGVVSSLGKGLAAASIGEPKWMWKFFQPSTRFRARGVGGAALRWT